MPKKGEKINLKDNCKFKLTCTIKLGCDGCKFYRKNKIEVEQESTIADDYLDYLNSRY